MSVFAALDVGSNSVKLLVGRPTNGPVEVLHDEVIVTRLSEGVDATHRLAPAALERSLAALRSFAETCERLGVEARTAVGTAVLRDAEDAERFLEPARALGFDLEIVSGDTEAEIVRLAAVRELPEAGAEAVCVDIGGGSTEVVWAGGAQSTELGVVRLSERHVHCDPPGLETRDRLREVIAARLAELPIAGAPAVVGSSGTCTLAARIHLGLADYDPERLHGVRMPVAAIEAIGERLALATQAERMTFTRMNEMRADVLLAGVCVLAGAARAAGVEEVWISDRGTRFGIFHRAFALP